MHVLNDKLQPQLINMTTLYRLCTVIKLLMVLSCSTPINDAITDILICVFLCVCGIFYGTSWGWQVHWRHYVGKLLGQRDITC